MADERRNRDVVVGGRLKLTVPLVGAGMPVLPVLDGARPVDPGGDREALARLLLDAYRGTVDDDGETLADARAEVNRTLDGGYGDFDGGASEVVERDGRIVAATLVTRYGGVPLVAFTMTDPAWQRRGLARVGLLRVMSRLAARGEERLDLVVTETNEPALRLYRGLGFAPHD